MIEQNKTQELIEKYIREWHDFLELQDEKRKAIAEVLAKKSLAEINFNKHYRIHAF